MVGSGLVSTGTGYEIEIRNYFKKCKTFFQTFLADLNIEDKKEAHSYVDFYDVFFGPGTGSFLVFALVRVLGYDFLNASAHAKVLNTASNLAALLLFALKGHVWWHIAFYLAVANVMGSWLGTRLALKHGAGFVRWVFVLVVSALIVKTGWDAFIR